MRSHTAKIRPDRVGFGSVMRKMIDTQYGILIVNTEADR